MSTTDIAASQINANSENCADRQAALYEAIRYRISQSFFSRTRIDEDELLHVLFLKVVDQFYPPLDSDEFTEFLNQEIADTIREFKRSVRPTRDIDDVDPDEGPAYEANADEEEFEKTFERFCDAQDEPKRSVYRRFRTHTLAQLAEIYGLPLKTVSKMVKRMPNEFQKFLENFRD
jgi:DNA-directed RNA polymerase specialized sigma24 family protein